MQELPAELNALLDNLCSSFSDIFMENLVGIYIHGSLSYDAFEPQRSDVDIFVIYSRKFSIDTYLKIETLFQQLLKKYPIWTPQLELDMAKKDDFTPMLHNTIKTYGFKHACFGKSSMKGFALEAANLRECGITLLGESPKELIPDISLPMIYEALDEKFQEAQKLFKKYRKEDFWNQMYLSILLFRMVYTLRHKGAPISKKQAGDWAKENLPEKFQEMAEIARQGIDECERPISDEIDEKLPELFSYVRQELDRKRK